MTELATHHDLVVLRGDMEALGRALRAEMDNLGLRLTVRMGVMLAAGLSLLGVVLKLH